MDNYDAFDPISRLLDLYSLEEVFDILDIEPYDVVAHLLQAGLVVLPPFLNDSNDDENNDGLSNEEQEAFDQT